MDNIYEMSGNLKKDYCDGCGKRTIVYEEGTITPLSRKLILERWLCPKCLH